MISILVPTRKRPDNVKRLVNSALSLAQNPEKIEFIFYVDYDDLSFDFTLINKNLKVIQGPRVWISLAYNILYTHSKGEIIMYGADDIIFRTKMWDSFIREEFHKVPDKICLVYTNDGVEQSQNIARHGFIHRKWFDVTSSAFPAYRTIPIDLWCTDIASKLNRLRYLDSVVIEHIHFRQGRKASLDETYIDAISKAKSWVPKKTYKKLKYEMRIDRILLSEVMLDKPKIEINYILGELFSRRNRLMHFFNFDSRRLKSESNLELGVIACQKLIKLLLIIPKILLRRIKIM